jgi:hypothetical protein
MMKFHYYILILLGMNSYTSRAQSTNTVGALHNDKDLTSEGLTLFSAFNQKSVFLVDECGKLANEWEIEGGAISQYLLPGGDLLVLTTKGFGTHPSIKKGGGADALRLYSWNGELKWEYEYVSDSSRLHHDIAPMANGHILLLAWEMKSKNSSLAKGRLEESIEENVIWSEKVIELSPSYLNGFADEIVWEWDIWDHTVQDEDSSKSGYSVIRDHPELLDINYRANNSADWLHINSLDYNEARQEIMMSIHSNGELLIIDKSTSTSEAKGHIGGDKGRGGDLIYRWGNPMAYDAGDSSDRILFNQHNATWVDKSSPDFGKISVFNNGTGRYKSEFYTSIELFTPEMNSSGDDYFLNSSNTFLPKEPGYTYTADDKESFFASYISGVQSLPNGNLLICDGANGEIREVTKGGELAWKYVNPAYNGQRIVQGDSLPLNILKRSLNILFRAHKYPRDHSIFDGLTLTADGYVEENGNDSVCMKQDTTTTSVATLYMGGINVYPNPTTSGYINISMTEPVPNLAIWNSYGQRVIDIEPQNQSKTLLVDINSLEPGMYFVTDTNGQLKTKLLIQ